MTDNTDKKLKRFLRQAHVNAGIFSKDRSTKVAAFYIDTQDYTQLAQGYNGMPRGMDESVPARHERPLKYDFAEHAERNGIYNLARQRLKGSLVVTTKYPVLSCIRALASVGAKALVCPAPTVRCESSEAILRECFVDVYYLDDAGSVTHSTDGQAAQERFARKTRQLFEECKTRAINLSKDPYADATVFVDTDDFNQLTWGYSGLPRGADDELTERYEPPLRDVWVEPSVRNAIYNLVRPTLRGSTCVVTATTCIECARAQAGVGAKRLVYTRPSPDFLSRWGSSINEALTLLREIGIEAVENTPET